MKTAIDSTGRVLIPRALRARASLSPGTELEAHYEDGRIVLEPAPLEARVQKKGLFFVADASEPDLALRQEDVDREIEALREGVPSVPSLQRSKKSSKKRPRSSR